MISIISLVNGQEKKLQRKPNVSEIYYDGKFSKKKGDFVDKKSADTWVKFFFPCVIVLSTCLGLWEILLVDIFEKSMSFYLQNGKGYNKI